MPSTRHPSSVAQVPRRGWKLAASRSPTSMQPSSSPPPNPSASAQPRRAGSSTSSSSPIAACASPNQVSSQPADTKPDPQAYGWLILGAMTPKTNQPSNPPAPTIQQRQPSQTPRSAAYRDPCSTGGGGVHGYGRRRPPVHR